MYVCVACVCVCVCFGVGKLGVVALLPCTGAANCQGQCPKSECTSVLPCRKVLGRTHNPGPEYV